MELTLIVAGLLAAAAGLVVAAAYVVRAVSVHRHDLAAAGARAAARAPVRRLLAGCDPLAARVRSRVRPGWFFSFSVVLGLSGIALGAAVTGTVLEDVTEGDGVAVLDRPVAGFVAAHRSGALTVVMRAVSAAGGPVVLAMVTAAAGVLLGILWRSWGPVVVAGVTVAAFGVLAYLCTARLRSWAGRVAIWAVAATLAALVGISRVYLGVHWTTDVIGGWAFGACWVAVVITGWITVTRHPAEGEPALPAVLVSWLAASGR